MNHTKEKFFTSFLEKIITTVKKGTLILCNQISILFIV
jgi:hypothetical protein